MTVRREQWEYDLKERLRDEARERLAERDEETAPLPPPMPKIGLYHEQSYVERTVALLKRSNFQSWPEAGGWANQDDLLVMDVQMYLALEVRMEWEARYGVEEDGDIIPLPTETKRFSMDQLG